MAENLYLLGCQSPTTTGPPTLSLGSYFIFLTQALHKGIHSKEFCM